MLAEHDLRAVLHDMADDAAGAPESVNFTPGATHPEVLLDPRDTDRIRRSRGWLLPLASAAAVAALTTGIVLVADGGRGGNTSAAGPNLNASSTTAGVPTDTDASVSASSSARTPSATVTITPQWTAKTLLGLLPKGGKASALSGNAGGNAVQIGLNYDDGNGVAGILFAVAYPAVNPSSSLDWQCSPTDVAGDNPKPHCSTLPNGTQVYEDSTADAGAYANPQNPDAWTIGVLRPDGLEVEITVQNGPYDAKYKTTRGHPLLTENQRLAIVTDAIWKARVPADQARAAAGLFTAGHSATDPIATPAP